MNILIMQSPVTFFLLGLHVLPCALFSNTINMQILVYSPIKGKEISHLYKTIFTCIKLTRTCALPNFKRLKAFLNYLQDLVHELVIVVVAGVQRSA
jgi:hypothetical protein